MSQHRLLAREQAARGGGDEAGQLQALVRGKAQRCWSGRSRWPWRAAHPPSGNLAAGLQARHGLWRTMRSTWAQVFSETRDETARERPHGRGQEEGAGRSCTGLIKAHNGGRCSWWAGTTAAQVWASAQVSSVALPPCDDLIDTWCCTKCCVVFLRREWRSSVAALRNALGSSGSHRQCPRLASSAAQPATVLVCEWFFLRGVGPDLETALVEKDRWVI